MSDQVFADGRGLRGMKARSARRFFPGKGQVHGRSRFCDGLQGVQSGAQDRHLPGRIAGQPKLAAKRIFDGR